MSITDNSLTDAAGSFLGRKYGPLPLGAWLVVAGGTAYFVRRYINKQQAANVQVGTDSNSNASDLTMGSSPAYSMPATSSPAMGGGYTTGSGSSGAYSDTTPSPTIPQSNQEWQSRGVGILVGLGYDAYQATLALQTYLAGKVLSPDQRAMVTQVVKALGAPPDTSTAITGQPTIQIAFAQNPGKPYTTVRLSVAAVDATGEPLSTTVMIQHQYPAIKNNWKDVGPVTLIGGKAVTPVGPTLVPGVNSFRAIGNGTTSNVLTISV